MSYPGVEQASGGRHVQTIGVHHEVELREAFMAEAKAVHRLASQVARELMRASRGVISRHHCIPYRRADTQHQLRKFCDADGNGGGLLVRNGQHSMESSVG